MYRQLQQQIQERERHEAEAAVIQHIRDEIWRLIDPEQVDDVLLAIRDGLHDLGVEFHGIGINEVDEAAGKVRYNTFVGDRGEWSLSDDEEQNARVVAFMKAGVPTYRPDLHHEDRWEERQRVEEGWGAPIRSIVDLPFDTGTFAINSRQADAFSESDLNLLQKVAAVLQEGFQRIRDLRTLQERSREAGQRASRRLHIRSGRRWRPSGSIEGKAGDGDPGPVPTTDDQRTLLIIEDEDVVRETTRRLLERQGFHVLAADSGPAGLKIVARGRCLHRSGTSRPVDANHVRT